MDLKVSDTPSWLHRSLRVFHEIRVEARRDNIALVSAGIAFYAVLAIIPALFIAVSLYGLFTDLSEAELQIETLLGVFPGSAAQIVAGQMRAISRSSEASLSIGFAVSVAAFVWTVSNATRALVRGVKIAYDQEEDRSVLERRAVAIVVTIVVLAFTMAAVAIIAAVPIWFRQFDGTGVIVTVENVRWVAVGAGFALVTGLLYRYAPPQPPDGLRAVLPGTAAATAMWIVTSVGFSVYVSSFGRYNETYGVLGAAIVLLLWFWFSALTVLIGAELNEAVAPRSQHPDGDVRGFGE